MACDSVPTEVADLIERDILTINDGYRAKNCELSDHGLPFARAGNIDGGFHFEGVDRFPEENLDRVGEKVSRTGDAVFTSKGTVGRFAYVTEDTPRFVYSPQLCFWRSIDHDVIDPRWLFYWMHSCEFLYQYSGVKGQTDMADYVSLRDQRRMHLTLPSLTEQRGTAEVLGSLDDKIKLNRKTNGALEAIARAIFNAWFIDFEPVKAKAAGARSFHGMPQDVFDQLPAEFTETKQRPVPAGWEVKPVGAVCLFNYGKALKDANRRDGGVPVYGSNGIVGWHDEAFVSGPGIVVGRKGNPGTVNWIATDFFPIDTTFYVSTTNKSLRISYLRYALDNLCLGSYGSDSAVPGLNRNIAHSLPIIIPDDVSLQAYDKLFLLFQAIIHTNQVENRTLANIRDALLPKLISGEIRVPSGKEVDNGG